MKSFRTNLLSNFNSNIKSHIVHNLKFTFRSSKTFSSLNNIDLIASDNSSTNFDAMKKLLISGKYESLLKQNYSEALNNLKSLKSSISHKKENKIDRELLLRINEALEFISFHNRTNEDHKNLSGIINEQSTYKVYNSVKKLFNINNKDILINHSTKDNRLVYFYNSIVSYILYF